MTWVTLGLCGLLLGVAATRMVSGGRRSIGAWAFLQVAILLSLAKLARTPHVADRFLDPPLQRATGLSNLMTLTGMTLGAMTAVPAVVLMASLLQYQPSIRLWLGAQAALAVAMVVSFVVSPIPHTPTSSFITSTVPTPWPASVWIYWSLFLGAVGLAATVNVVLAGRALRVVIQVPASERNRPFQLTLLGWAFTAGFAALYAANKLVNLSLTDAGHTSGWYMRHGATISLVLLLSVVVAAVGALLVNPTCLLPGRFRRFRRLQRDGDRWRAARAHSPNFALPGVPVPSTGLLSLWRASADPLVAASLRVELADAAAAATPPASSGPPRHE